MMIFHSYVSLPEGSFSSPVEDGMPLPDARTTGNSWKNIFQRASGAGKSLSLHKKHLAVNKNTLW